MLVKSSAHTAPPGLAEAMLGLQHQGGLPYLAGKLARSTARLATALRTAHHPPAAECRLGSSTRRVPPHLKGDGLNGKVPTLHHG